jgi:trans-L-3-hydroxyproline dehydratase
MSTSASSSYWIDTEDWHTAGEPFRIVENLPIGHLPDARSVAHRRAIVLDTPAHPLNTLRQLLCHEPRGHGDMYGGFITPPNDSGAHFGVLFWHKDGFSTACGHGTIALGYWAVKKGIVKVPEKDGTVDVIIDVPSGRVKASVMVKNEKPIFVDFVNVPSYQLSRPIAIPIPSYGIDAVVQLSYGGAIYALVKADQFELLVVPANVQKFVDLGREIKASLFEAGSNLPVQYDDIYGVIFFEDESKDSDIAHRIIRERNITVFADGQVDRSPCGSGTCARLAIHFANDKMTAGYGRLINRSIIGTVFEGSIMSQEEDNIVGKTTCTPVVKGKANLIGRMKFFIDPDDPVYPGFLLS